MRAILYARMSSKEQDAKVTVTLGTGILGAAGLVFDRAVPVLLNAVTMKSEPVLEGESIPMFLVD